MEFRVSVADGRDRANPVEIDCVISAGPQHLVGDLADALRPLFPLAGGSGAAGGRASVGGVGVGVVPMSVGVGVGLLVVGPAVGADCSWSVVRLAVAETVGAVRVVTGPRALTGGAGDGLVAAGVAAGVTGWLTAVPIPLQPRQATMANDPNCAAASAPSRLWL